MTVDLGQLLADAVEKATAPLVAEVAELRATVERLAARDEAAYLDTVGLARVLGCSPRALRMRLGRPSGDTLRALAVEIGGRRMWRRSDVDALARRGRR